MELRRFSRAPFEQSLEFTVKSTDARVAGHAKDISLGGMFVETPSPAPFGAELVIRVRLPGENADARLPGIVRWTSPNGMGIQFGLLGARETHAITEIVRRNNEG